MAYQVKKTRQFDEWLANLKDAVAQARIAKRLDDARDGHFGKHKRIEGGMASASWFSPSAQATASIMASSAMS